MPLTQHLPALNNRALGGSGQTVRIVCFGSSEADTHDLTMPLGFPVGAGGDDPAATAGDFDASGQPTAQGTAMIAVNCERFKLKWSGWAWFRLIAHELLHASSDKHTHPPEGIEVYDAWVRKLVDALPPDVIKWIIVEDMWREAAAELRARAKRIREEAKQHSPQKAREYEQAVAEADARALVDEKNAEEARAARRAGRTREAARAADDLVRAIEDAKHLATPEEQPGLDALLKRAKERAQKAHDDARKAEEALDAAKDATKKASDAVKD